MADDLSGKATPRQTRQILEDQPGLTLSSRCYCGIVSVWPGRITPLCMPLAARIASIVEP